MNYKTINKLISDMFLMAPLVTNAWDVVIPSNGGNAFSNGTGMGQNHGDLSGEAKNAMILIQDPSAGHRCSVQSSHFWLWIPTEPNTSPPSNGATYQTATTNPDKWRFLPDVPLFMASKPLEARGPKNTYTYPNYNGNGYVAKARSAGGGAGTHWSEILDPQGDAICCLKLREYVGTDLVLNGKTVFEQIVFYRYKKGCNRYFFFSHTAAQHCGLVDNGYTPFNLRATINGKAISLSNQNLLESIGSNNFIFKHANLVNSRPGERFNVFMPKGKDISASWSHAYTTTSKDHALLGAVGQCFAFNGNFYV
jgi:hypothetical protein